MIKINLIPVKEGKEIKGLRDLIIGVIAIIAVFILLVALQLWRIKQIKDVNIKIADVKARILKLEDVKKKVEEFKAKNKELQEKIEVIKVLEENRTGPLYVMEALGKAIPNRAWIDKLSEKGSSAKMEGFAWDELTVSDFMKRLQSFPYFQNVELKVINTKEIQQLPLKAFVIESRLNYSGKVKPEEKPQEIPEVKKPSQQKAQR
ncbi:MAG TPA: PilN domain-containing protein [Thermodesulfobacteriota bacterium]|nr:PilN domain-containing protein [Thermodesulfobacteriota bacterium]